MKREKSNEKREQFRALLDARRKNSADHGEGYRKDVEALASLFKKNRATNNDQASKEKNTTAGTTVSDFDRWRMHMERMIHELKA